MNSEERLSRIFQGKEVDRPALKLWGLSLDREMLHSAYKPVYDLAIEVSDIMLTAKSGSDIIYGVNKSDLMTLERKQVPNSTWVDEYRYLNLNKRKLRSIHRYSTIGEPGYTLEYFVKKPDDLRAILNMPYTPVPLNTDNYYNKKKQLGNRGVVMFSLDNTAYAIYRMLGSVNFALMNYDEHDLMKEAADIYSKRIINLVKSVISNGLIPIFAWVGPEICIPPLAGMNDFEEFVFKYDKKICDIIHDAGGYVWVHCHGKVGDLLTRFADMGVDVLNPIEPPPQGDITLRDAIKKIDKRMGLEGNIEIMSLLLESKEEIAETIDDAVYEGIKANRFILCPSAGYMEYVDPTPQYIENLMIYLQRGYDKLQKNIR